MSARTKKSGKTYERMDRKELLAAAGRLAARIKAEKRESGKPTYAWEEHLASARRFIRTGDDRGSVILRLISVGLAASRYRRLYSGATP